MNKKFPGNRIIIIGAGEAGRIILSEYTRKNRKSEIIGFIDDDKEKIGESIEGIPVLSDRKNLSEIIRQHKINQAIIALPSIHAEIINQTVSSIISTDPNVSIQILPKVAKYFSSPLSGQLEDVFLSDLIDRDEYDLDIEAIEDKYTGKTILITGAGGSIGSEICRQLLRFNIKRLICVGRGEFSIYSLMNSLTEQLEFIEKKPEVIYKIIDVKDFKLLEKEFERYKPEIVFHAAAHKHVPLMEWNEIEAMQNNIGGTYNVLSLSAKYYVKNFVLISSDKAVNPFNVMGATKRFAEILTGIFFDEGKLNTSIVRFGNVFGSRGSIIPLFKEQIERGGPVTVTDPDVTRFFMSIPEASLLVLNAAAYSNGFDCFVLDMGRQYKIVDVAASLIRFYGFEPDKDIKIEFTGLRQGDKMYEELSYDKTLMRKTKNNKIYLLNENKTGNIEKIDRFIKDELWNLQGYTSEGIRKLLKEFVPEYIYE